MSDSVVVHNSGASTSDAPRFDLLPSGALRRLVARFEKGSIKYGRDNWRKGLTNRDYVLERLSHVIDHALKLRDKIEGRIADDGDDDASAIMWGGAFLCEATDALKRNCSACGGAGVHGDNHYCPACKGTGKEQRL